MYLSVVMPARNAAATIGTQLQALAGQRYEGRWEVIVADNGSSDGSREIAGRFDGQLRLAVVDASAATGVAAVRNLGARHARGDFLLFCDADDRAAPGWLAAMAEAAARCDAVGGRLDERSLNDPTTALQRGSRLDDGLSRALGFLCHPQGANCGVRRSLFEQLGGFDESYLGGGDDVEFFWRVQLEGASVCFVPDAVMAYRHRASLLGMARQYLRYGRSVPRLYRDFAPHGLVRPPYREAIRSWAWILRHITDLRGEPSVQGTWVRVAASRAGRVWGSAVHRTLVL